MAINEFEIEFDIKSNEFEIEMENVVKEIYPELEDLEVTPSAEEQNFTGAYRNVKVNRIETEELNIVPSKENQGFKGLFGNVKVNRVTSDIDENIKAENIKAGINILGVDGGYEGIDTSDATALSEDILQDKTAYVNNEKITGTMQDYDGSYSGNGETGNEWEKIFTSSIDGSLGANVTKLPSGITSIGSNAFRENSKLALKELPETIRTIGAYAFYNCTNLALTKLPSELTSLGNYCFYSCTKLSFSEIPSNVTILPLFCFNKCSGLTSVTILGNITEFEGQVFYQASNLERVVLSNITSVPVMGSNVFSNTKIAQKQGYIYVPDNLVEEIKVATKWSDYASQIKPISELGG
jgi:hypothetical protein